MARMAPIGMDREEDNFFSHYKPEDHDEDGESEGELFDQQEAPHVTPGVQELPASWHRPRCSQCGNEDSAEGGGRYGHSEDEGKFFCGRCWSSWDAVEKAKIMRPAYLQSVLNLTAAKFDALSPGLRGRGDLAEAMLESWRMEEEGFASGQAEPEDLHEWLRQVDPTGALDKYQEALGDAYDTFEQVAQLYRPSRSGKALYDPELSQIFEDLGVETLEDRSKFVAWFRAWRRRAVASEDLRCQPKGRGAGSGKGKGKGKGKTKARGEGYGLEKPSQLASKQLLPREGAALEDNDLDCELVD